MLSRDPVFADLAEHPTALGFVKAILGWPALLGNISANITGPGGGEMVLHADQIFVPEPWPAEPQGMNVAWCLDDFTEANGATRIVPGSHRLNRAPRPKTTGLETVPMEAPAGSIVVFESRVWHKTGFNRTKDQRRAGVFAWYTKPIYRQQENWFLPSTRSPPVRLRRDAGPAGLPDRGAGSRLRRLARLNPKSQERSMPLDTAESPPGQGSPSTGASRRRLSPRST